MVGEKILCAGCGHEVKVVKTEAGYYTYCPCDYGNQFRYNFLGITERSSLEQFASDRKAALIIIPGQPVKFKKRYYKVKKEKAHARKQDSESERNIP